MGVENYMPKLKDQKIRFTVTVASGCINFMVLQFVCIDRCHPECEEEQAKRKQVIKQGEKAVSPCSWIWICLAEPPVLLIS